MPKIVDHRVRREELLSAVTRVIARAGLEGATLRAIADESGWSTGSLAHYFSDRGDIVASALRYSHRLINERWARKLRGKQGVAALRELILDNLPLDKERTVETKLEVMFWGQSLSSSDLLDIQREEGNDLFVRTRQCVTEAQVNNEIDGLHDPRLVTERLLALVDGMSVHRILHGSRLSRADMIEIIDQELESLAGGAPRT